MLFLLISLHTIPFLLSSFFFLVFRISCWIIADRERTTQYRSERTYNGIQGDAIENSFMIIVIFTTSAGQRTITGEGRASAILLQGSFPTAWAGHTPMSAASNW